MAIDYHIHTWRCRHATGKPADYLASAVRKGMSEIGFSDHAPYLTEHRAAIRKSIPLEKIAMPAAELPAYAADIAELRKQSPIPVKLGCEVDFFPGSPTIFNLLKPWDFDYFIGSVHFIDGWGFDQEQFKEGFSGKGLKSVYQRYLGLVASMAGTRLFDIAGHFDLPKKFGDRPPRGLEADFRRTLTAIRANRMAVELNTSGWDRPVGEAYPSPRIIGLCFEMNIPFTLGSDSHAAIEVGRHFDRAVRLLRKAGYRKLASFSNHVLKPVAL